MATANNHFFGAIVYANIKFNFHGPINFAIVKFVTKISGKEELTMLYCIFPDRIINKEEEFTVPIKQIQLKDEELFGIILKTHNIVPIFVNIKSRYEHSDSRR